MDNNIKQYLEVLRYTRSSFIRLLEKYSLEEINKIPEGFNNNLIWNFAHCIVTKKGLCYVPSGNRTNLPKEYIKKYKNGSVPCPHNPVGEEEYSFWKEVAISSIDDLENDLKNQIFGNFHPYNIGKKEFNNIDEAIIFNNFHEATHYGIALAIKKFL